MKHNAYTKQAQCVVIICFFIALIFLFSHTKPENPNKDTAVEISKNEEKLLYVHGNNTFRFTYPGNMKSSTFVEENKSNATETVVFSSEEKNKGFQIFIAPYESTAPLTIETIVQENKNLDIFDSKVMDINGEEGVVFLSAEKGTPTNTREIWFTHQGKIYQVSTYPDYGETVFGILTSWLWLQ